MFLAIFEAKWPGVRILAIPNGGWRHPATAKRLRAEGVRPGVPDLFIPSWNVWVEIKRAKGGRVSQAQADWHEYLASIGHAVIVARGAIDGIKQVEEFYKKKLTKAKKRGIAARQRPIIS